MVCSTPTDQHEYFVLMTVAVTALMATPPSRVSTQHLHSQQLLTHIQQHVGRLEAGVARGRSQVCVELEEVFVPLLQKRRDVGVAFSRLLLWVLHGVSGCVLMPQDLSASTCLKIST